MDGKEIMEDEAQDRNEIGSKVLQSISLSLPEWVPGAMRTIFGVLVLINCTVIAHFLLFVPKNSYNQGILVTVQGVIVFFYLLTFRFVY